MHMIDNLDTRTQNEYFFDSFNKFFNKIEKNCAKDIFPFENDIFVTKHSNSTCFDVILNIFTKSKDSNEEDITTSNFN